MCPDRGRRVDARQEPREHWLLWLCDVGVDMRGACGKERRNRNRHLIGAVLPAVLARIILPFRHEIAARQIGCCRADHGGIGAALHRALLEIPAAYIDAEGGRAEQHRQGDSRHDGDPA